MNKSWKLESVRLLYSYFNAWILCLNITGYTWIQLNIETTEKSANEMEIIMRRGDPE